MKKEENENRKPTAIIVRSPFQVICALEAIHKFEINAPIFFVQGNDNSARMTSDYITAQGYQLINVDETKNTVDAIRRNIKHKKYT